LRYDPNLRVSAPPFWPELEWIDADPPSLLFSPHAQDVRDRELTGEEFLPAWQDGLLSLLIIPHPEMAGGREPLSLGTWLDGVRIQTRIDTLEAGSPLLYHPWVELPAEGRHRVHLSVEWDAQAFNTNGEACRWVYSFPDPYPPRVTVSPLALELCAQPSGWQTFQDQLAAGEIWVDFHASRMAPGGQETLSLYTYTEQGPMDSLSGPVMAGQTVRVFPDLSGLQEEPEFIAFEIRWRSYAWNPEGSECRWTIGSVSVPRNEPGLQPSTLALRIAPNPANPTFTIDYEVPVAGETTLELYDLRGCKVRTLVDGWAAAGSRRETVDLGPGASGLYFVRLVTPAGQRVEKVLVLR